MIKRKISSEQKAEILNEIMCQVKPGLINDENKLAFLKAGAGTGKTYTLTWLYIYHLVKYDLDPSEILAVTFTKKAAGEMKERIRRFLKSLIKNCKAKKEKNTLISGRTVQEYLINKYISLSQNRIMTIDSFFYYVLKKYRLYSGVSLEYSAGSELNIEKEVKTIIKKAILSQEVEIIENLSFFISRDKISTLEIIKDFFFEIFTKRYEFEKFSKEVKNKQVKDILEEQYKDLLLGIQVDKFPKKNREFLTELRNLKFDKCTIKQIKRFKEIVNSVDEKGKDFLSKSNKKKVYTYLIILEDLFSQENRDKYFHFIRNVIHIFRDIIHPQIEMKMKELNYVSFSEISLKIEELLKNDSICRSINKEFKFVFLDEFQDTSDLQKSIIDKIFQNDLDRIFAVGDIKQCIYNFRNSNPEIFLQYDKTVPDSNKNILNISYRSSENLVCIFNDLIMDIFEKEYSLLKKENEANIFSESGLKANRTNVDLVDKDNSYFPAAVYFNEDDLSEYEPLSAAADYIDFIVNELEIRFSEESSKSSNILKYKDIAVLFRTNSEIKEFSNILVEKRIPFYVYNNSEIMDERYIINIFTYLKFLFNPDKYNLFEFLKSDFVGVQDSTLFLINEFYSEINENLMSLNNDIFISEILQQEMKIKCEEVFEKRRLISEEEEIEINPLNDLVEDIEKINKAFYDFKIISDFRDKDLVFLMEKILDITGYKYYLSLQANGEEKLFNLDLFIEKVNDILKNYSPNLYELQLLLKDKFRSETVENLSTESMNAVKILTMHKSKGLEFPFVIIPGLDKGKNYSVSNNLHIKDGKLLLNTRYKLYSNSLRSIEERIAEEKEALRLFYVAVTRAKDHIALFQGKKLTKSSVYSFLQSSAVLKSIRERQNISLSGFLNKKKKTDSSSLEIKIDLCRSVEVNEKKIDEEIYDMLNLRFPKEDLSPQEKGDIIHSIIASVLKPGSSKVLIRSAEKMINEMMLDDKNKEYFFKNIQKILSSKKILDWLNDDKFVMKKEITYLTKLDNREIKTGTADLVFINRTENIFILVDYKSSINNISKEKYAEQLNRYERVFRRVYSDYNFKKYLFDIREGELVLIP